MGAPREESTSRVASSTGRPGSNWWAPARRICQVVAPLVVMAALPMSASAASPGAVRAVTSPSAGIHTGVLETRRPSRATVHIRTAVPSHGESRRWEIDIPPVPAPAPICDTCARAASGGPPAATVVTSASDTRSPAELGVGARDVPAAAPGGPIILTGGGVNRQSWLRAAEEGVIVIALLSAGLAIRSRQPVL